MLSMNLPINRGLLMRLYKVRTCYIFMAAEIRSACHSKLLRPQQLISHEIFHVLIKSSECREHKLTKWTIGFYKNSYNNSPFNNFFLHLFCTDFWCCAMFKTPKTRHQSQGQKWIRNLEISDYMVPRERKILRR